MHCACSSPASLNEALKHLRNLYRHWNGLLLFWLPNHSSTHQSKFLRAIWKERNRLVRSSAIERCSFPLLLGLFHPWSILLALCFRFCHHPHPWRFGNGRISCSHYVSHLENISRFKRSGSLRPRSGSKFRGLPWAVIGTSLFNLVGYFGAFFFSVSAHFLDDFLFTRFLRKQRAHKSWPVKLTHLLKFTKG